MGSRVVENTYLNMDRFEYSISNQGIKKQNLIDKRRRILFIDKIIKLFILTFMAFIVIMSLLIVYETVVSIKNDYDIKTIQMKLTAKSNNYNELLTNAYDEKNIERIKNKAYLEYNMITPTEKNIIYFDKSIALDVYKE